MARSSDPIQARRIATVIVQRLRASGHTAYFAGGCVRDELLGLAPTDYDVATDATPPRVRDLFPRTAEVGAAFGVVLVKESGVVVEVATFRSDGPYSDARRPDSVHFSDARSDAQRRDFTINALFLDPVAAADAPSIHGHVVDYVGGMADLRDRMLRAVGDADQRLAEDHLRALRAVRFAARLGFRIDPGTLAAIRRHNAELRGVSRERIGDELRRMLTHPSRAAALGLLQELGLDAPVLDERTIANPLPTVTALADSPPPSVPLGLAAWALDRIGAVRDAKPTVSRWRRALSLSNEETDHFGDILEGYLGLVGVSGQAWLDAGVANQKRRAAKAWFADALRLVQIREAPVAARMESRLRELGESPGGIDPPVLVTGDDLVAMGFTPGKRFKTVLDAVRDAQLEGRVLDRPAAMELARGMGV